MKTGDYLYCKVDQSPRLPRAVLTPNLHHGRQDLFNPETRTSSDHQSERSAEYEETRRLRYEETRRGNVDYRIQGVPHSAVQKEDSTRKEIVKIQIQQFENHLNRDSLIGNKTEEFNPFSEQSKELITSMGNTEYFELCEISSKIQCVLGAAPSSGLEGSKRLVRRWDPLSGGQRRALLHRCKLQDLPSGLGKWEELLRRYERSTSSGTTRAGLDEDIKTAALEALVPSESQQHFAMRRARRKSMFEDKFKPTSKPAEVNSHSRQLLRRTLQVRWM